MQSQDSETKILSDFNSHWTTIYLKNQPHFLTFSYIWWQKIVCGEGRSMWDIQFPSNFVSQFLNFIQRHIFIVNCDKSCWWRTFPMKWYFQSNIPRTCFYSINWFRDDLFPSVILFYIEEKVDQVEFYSICN